MDVFLIGGIKWETLFGMIVEGARVVKFLVTLGTGDGFGLVVDFHDFLHFFSIVNAETMNDTVTLGERTELTAVKRALKLFGVLCFCFELFWMFGTHVEIQRLLLEEALFTEFTLMRQLLLVLFHMIVHRGLIAFLVITVGACE